jgi:hypothetical protein
MRQRQKRRAERSRTCTVLRRCMKSSPKKSATLVRAAGRERASRPYTVPDTGAASWKGWWFCCEVYAGEKIRTGWVHRQGAGARMKNIHGRRNGPRLSQATSTSACPLLSYSHKIEVTHTVCPAIDLVGGFELVPFSPPFALPCVLLQLARTYEPQQVHMYTRACEMASTENLEILWAGWRRIERIQVLHDQATEGSLSECITRSTPDARWCRLIVLVQTVCGSQANRPP